MTSPVRLSGEAVGPWYFEGSFPVSVVAQDGTVLGQGFVSAQAEWMVDGLVPFTGEVEFEAPAGGSRDQASADEQGRAASALPVTLVLARDNPSDLPEHDAALHVMVGVAVGAGE